MIVLIFKFFRKTKNFCLQKIENAYTFVVLKGNNVSHESIRCNGIPYIMVAKAGKFTIGKFFTMNNGIRGNPIGCYSKCTFFVDNGATLTIGNFVGVSQTAIICYQSITIGNNVKIGGGVKIYDTDFHSLDAKIRNSAEDAENKVTAPVVIKDNVFIGAYSLILKGVTIGENCIIGAGSIVTKSIPDNQIWAGNPAKFIKNL